MNSQSTHGLLESLRTICPLLLLLLFCFVSAVDSLLIARKAKTNVTKIFGLGKRSFHLQMREWKAINWCLRWLSVGVLMTYVTDMLIYLIHVRMAWSEQWWGGESMAIYLVCSVVLYTILLMTLLSAKAPPIAPFICWVVALPMELCILGNSLARYASVHREPTVGNPHGGPVREGMTTWEAIAVALSSVRIVILCTLALLYSHRFLSVTEPHDPETTGLLASDTESGSVIDQTCESASGSCWEYMSLYAPFWPCMWPSKSGRLQSVVAACYFLVALQVWLKALSNSQIGVITTALAKQDGAEVISIPWTEVFLYVFYYYLPEPLGILRAALWVPMNLYTYRELSTAGLTHSYSLDLEYHQSKKTGEIASALNKSKSITEFQEQILFEVVPAMLGLMYAIYYFLVGFDAYYALVIGLSYLVYFYVTIRMAQWRAEAKREMTKAAKEEEAIKTELLDLYKEVKVCCAVRQKIDRYLVALEHNLQLQFVTKLRGTVQNFCQSSLLMACFLCVCCIALYQVSLGIRPVGDFVQVITYMSQLLIPLSSFARLYDTTQTAIINAERMLEVLGTKPTLADRCRDVPSNIISGAIKFENVTYSRNGQVILKGFTHTFHPGETTAIVGESGGGKSTIIDLICGFYKFEGTITVGGYDVTRYNLGGHIAVALQDTLLFNESLIDNLKSGNPGATDTEIKEACRDAAILDKINKTSGGFSAMAGPRGKNLSGGERQRVAIARLFATKRNFLLLDEATSALDPKTEEHVLNALANTHGGRTTVVITHRLKTIRSVDRILVLQGGKIVERGTHRELVELDGYYASLWAAERAPYV
ncbi:Vacuolar ABC heavy metal transporter (H.t1.c1) [Penicillium sp. IBT 18751x]|nr:Vacuolar ABC heavy metal transporter (H.t1.c1) [Penicillium sp. IBT 18751x]